MPSICDMILKWSVFKGLPWCGGFRGRLWGRGVPTRALPPGCRLRQQGDGRRSFSFLPHFRRPVCSVSYPDSSSAVPVPLFPAMYFTP